ncbi:Hok/Gef family protein [Escherichia coli]|nr:Hok/Gef family protein [Escherichia coli]
MVVWILHSSPCEFRPGIMWSGFTAFLQCRQ